MLESPGESSRPLATDAYVDDLVSGGLWTAIGSAVSLPSTLISSLVLSRALGPSGLGQLGTLSADLALFLIFSNIGIDAAAIRWIARARSTMDTASVASIIKFCSLFHVLIQGPSILGFALYAFRNQPLWMSLTIGLTLYATQFFDAASVIIVASAQNNFAARLVLVCTLIGQAATISIALCTRSGHEVFLVQVLASLVPPIVSFIHIGKVYRRCVVRFWVRPDLPKGWWGYALNSYGSSALGVIVFGRSELVVLGASHEEIAAGLFVIASGLASQITIPMDSLQAALTPTLTAIWASNQKRANGYAQRALQLTSLAGATTAAVFIPAIVLLIPEVFGSKYRNAGTAFMVLGLISCLQSIVVPLTAIADAMGAAGYILKANLAASIVDISLAIALIPHIGLSGAVIATGSAQLASLTCIIITFIWKVHTLRAPIIRAVISIASLSLVIVAGHEIQPVIPVVAAPLTLYLMLRVSNSSRLTAQDIAALSARLPAPAAYVLDVFSKRLPLIAD